MWLDPVSPDLKEPGSCGPPTSMQPDPTVESDASGNGMEERASPRRGGGGATNGEGGGGKAWAADGVTAKLCERERRWERERER